MVDAVLCPARSSAEIFVVVVCFVVVLLVVVFARWLMIDDVFEKRRCIVGMLDIVGYWLCYVVGVKSRGSRLLDYEFLERKAFHGMQLLGEIVLGGRLFEGPSHFLGNF